MAKHLRRLGRVHFLLGARAAAPIELKVARTPAPAKAGIGAGLAEAVILAALGLIAQNVVGRLNFFEASLGLFVARVAVRVILPGELAMSFLDLLLGGVALDPQGLVKIAGHE